MVFSRLFGKSQAEKASADVDATEDVAAPVEESPEDEAAAHVDEHADYATRARRVIAGGASTGSKRPEKLFGDAADVPTHFVRASGCRVETAEGQELIDCTMALGSVALGYAEPQLTRAVIESLAGGS